MVAPTLLPHIPSAPCSTDRSGNFQRGIDTLHEPIGWTKETQAQLAFSIVAREAGIDDVGIVHQAVEDLHLILPSTMTQRLAAMPPANVARMALYKLDHIAQRMVALRSLWPDKGDLGHIVAGCPSLLWCPMQQIQEVVDESHRLLGEGNHDGLMMLLEAQPVLLEPGVAAAVCIELERLFGVGEDPPKRLRMLLRDPSLVLSLMPLHAQVRGELMLQRGRHTHTP